ncbi:hypothetical protein ACFWA9_29185 [Kitasatospora sp. NPDC059973]|uniref:hypothetical protein n=1 Tax=Kitasatospora sp. NPDC059973 TaxID=3347020 RepID=UPI00368369DC
MKHRQHQDPAEAEAWRAVAREVLRAFDLVMLPPRTLTREQARALVAEHVRRGRELLAPLIDRYADAARTRWGRAWRRRRAERGPYAAAFAEAAVWADAVSRGGGDGLPWPVLFTRGRLPLIDRYTGDRRSLDAS